jgi:DNA-binding NtrC family response regulator
VELLAKPYTRDALARKVRHVLANQAQRQAAVRPPQQQPKRDALKGARVLLVEDDELIRATTAEMLSEIGCLAKEASTAEEALKVLDGGPVDVLLTDVGLPGISGLQLARDARSRRIDLSLVLATGDSGVRSEAALLGAVLLLKPYDRDRLRQALEEALSVDRIGGMS